MDKNSIIGFVLIAAIFIGFSLYQSSQTRKRLELQAQLDSVARVEALERDLAEAERLSALPDSLAGLPVETRAIYKDSSLEAASRGEAQDRKSVV